jgi:aspartate 1-decarboxylase
LNGATAHLGKIGDRLTIMNFAHYSAEEAIVHRPRVIVLDEANEVVSTEREMAEYGAGVAGA